MRKLLRLLRGVVSQALARTQLSLLSKRHFSTRETLWKGKLFFFCSQHSLCYRGEFCLLTDLVNLFVFWFRCLCSWLHGLIATYAEPNPDKPEVHLPMGMKSDVHSMYMDEVRCGNNDLHPVSSNWFNSVWRVRVPHLKVRVFHR